MEINWTAYAKAWYKCGMAMMFVFALIGLYLGMWLMLIVCLTNFMFLLTSYRYVRLVELQNLLIEHQQNTIQEMYNGWEKCFEKTEALKNEKKNKAMGKRRGHPAPKVSKEKDTLQTNR